MWTWKEPDSALQCKSMSSTCKKSERMTSLLYQRQTEKIMCCLVKDMLKTFRLDTLDGRLSFSKSHHGITRKITVFHDKEVEFSKVQSLNGWLKPVGIGAFHCAVQASPQICGLDMGVENGGLAGTKVKKMLWRTVTGVEDTQHEWIYQPMYKKEHKTLLSVCYPWFQIPGLWCWMELWRMARGQDFSCIADTFTYRHGHFNLQGKTPRGSRRCNGRLEPRNWGNRIRFLWGQRGFLEKRQISHGKTFKLPPIFFLGDLGKMPPCHCPWLRFGAVYLKCLVIIPFARWGPVFWRGCRNGNAWWYEGFVFLQPLSSCVFFPFSSLFFSQVAVLCNLQIWADIHSQDGTAIWLKVFCIPSFLPFNMSVASIESEWDMVSIVLEDRDGGGIAADLQDLWKQSMLGECSRRPNSKYNYPNSKYSY